MIHEKLEGLMTPVEKIARVANAGLVAATTPQTSPSGAISLDNADGTRTIIGEVSNGEANPSYTMATHVGDTTPPGIPTGLTATSRSGVVVVEWDGTLSGGIPDDFFCVRILLDGQELGALSEAGSVASAKLQSGTTHSITATSEDDCCLPDGTPAHNVSEATQAISVTVAKDASEVMADIDEQIEGVEQEIADFKADTYTKAQTDKKVQDLDDEISTELTTNYYNKSQIDTTYATKTLVSQTKEEIELSASQTYANKGAGNPNLSPFYAHDLSDVRSTDNPDGYWYQRPSRTTQLEDGWAHIVMDNSSGSGSMYAYMRAAPDAAPAVEGTMLVEVRNLVTDIAAEARQLWWNPQQASAGSIQVHGDMVQYWWEDGAKYFDIHPTGAASPTMWGNMWFAVSKGRKAEFDARISYYANTEATIDGQQVTLPYEGSFKPYVTSPTALSKEYSTKAELTVGLDGVRSEVSQTYSTKQQTADAIAAIQVGGRNLITLENTYNGWLSENGGEGNPGTANNRRTGLIPVEGGEPYVAQTWVETFNNTSDGAAVYLVWYDANETYISGIPKAGGSGSKYQVIKATAPANAAYARVSWRAHRVGYAKLEQGTMPTDYTAAPEDLVARPNLTPFGSHDLTDVYDATSNPEGYWRQRPAAAYVTQLPDGWLHFERVNSGTGVVGSSMQIRPIPGVDPGDLLTVLIEVRNNQSTAMSSTGNFDDLYVQQGTNFQLWGTTVQSSTTTNSAQAKPLSALGESFELRFTKVVDSDHKTGDYIVGFAINIRNGAGQTLSFDFRVSVYKGGYEGGYVPYSIEDTTLSKTYTKSSTFKQTVDGLDGRITATEDGITLLDTLIRLFQGGVLAGYVGNAVSALMNAAGSFDVVQTTWQNDNPTIVDTLASFGANLVEIGKNSANAVIDFCAGGVRIAYDSVRAGFNILSSLAVILESRGTSNQNVSLYATEDNDPATSHPAREAWINAHASSAQGSASIHLEAGECDSEGSRSSGGVINILDYGTIISQSGFIVLTAGDGVRVDNSANNQLGTLIGGIFFGSKIINPNGAAYGTLFTQAECVSSFGRALSQSKDVVLVMNGDTGVYSGQMTASLNSSSEVRVYMSPTRSGATRINYLVVLGA